MANFPTAGVTCVNLFEILWQAVELLERSDFTVVFQTADGSSPNRRYFNMHQDPSNLHQLVHKAINPYSAIKGKLVYFFSDAPHLLKTARNNLSNSGSHTFSRQLWNGMAISWKHLLQLEEALMHCSKQSAGLHIAYKLKREHFHLTSFSKMRVSLAVQILSRSTCEALQYYAIPGSAGTQTFLLFMDRFFDMLNVRSKDEWIHKKKNDLKPYTSPNDSRLTWLEDAFLGYLDAWKVAVSERTGYTKAEKALMMFSHETQVGLRMTVLSFVAVVKELLQHPELQGHYLLSERFSQDPLENFFGKVRQPGGRNTNPSVIRMQEATDLLRLQASATLDEVRSESRLKKRLFPQQPGVSQSVPLPKRPKKIN